LNLPLCVRKLARRRQAPFAPPLVLYSVSRPEFFLRVAISFVA
jgi:hypothetical protein